MPNHKLSPSDFAFLWLECKRCFYLKLIHKFARPRMPMPGIFSVIDSRMKNCYMGRRTETIADGLPPGEIYLGEKWVESQPFTIPGRASTAYIRGKFDTVIRFDDGTYGVIDFKTSKVKPTSIFLYARQLHAYAHALESPAPDKLALGPVSKLGLLVYEPTRFLHESGGEASLNGSLTWLEIKRDEKAFLKFMGDILRVLDLPDPPEPGSKCLFCQYRDDSRKTDW